MRFLKSVRLRLTIWYLVVIVVLLGVFGTVAYVMLSHNLYQNLDDSLKNRLTELQTTLQVQGPRAVFVAQLNEVVLVYNANGVLLQRIGPDVQFKDVDEVVKQALAGQVSLVTASSTDGQEVRLYAAQSVLGFNARIVIVVGRPMAEIKNVLGTFRYILGVSGLGVVVLAGVGGYFLANRALRPVDRITRTAQEIGESDLSRRIDVSGEDELGRLASTLNRMFERLDAAFSRQRQFTADASHELRTPLAVIQAESTLALSKERTEAEYQKSPQLVSQEVAYMSAIIDKMLFLARSDAGKEPLNIEDVNVKELLVQLSSDIEVLARDKGLQISLGPVEDLVVKGDRVKLMQLFLNILENAVRYTPRGGSISGSAVRKDHTAVVAIADTGVGIAPEHLPHIFERFYREDKARSRSEGGVGLGLAIAKYIAEVHGGKIEAESQPGKGTTFYVTLPLGDSASPETV